MQLFDFIIEYWTSLLPLAVLGCIYVAVAALSIFFQVDKTDSGRRARLLTWIFTLNLLGWSFIAVSLAFCNIFVESYEYNLQEGIRNIVGQAFMASLLIAFPLSLFAKKRASRMLLGGMPSKESASGELALDFKSLKEKMKAPRTQLYLADLPAPLSMAASGRSNVVVVARSLVKLLTPEELTAVLAHELAHIRNGDSFLKTLAVVYRRFLPIDPVIRLLEPAIHREREFFADEIAARITGHPLSLASALIKIHDAYPPSAPTTVTGLSIMGTSRGIFSRHPSLKARVERLLHLAEALPIE